MLSLTDYIKVEFPANLPWFILCGHRLSAWGNFMQLVEYDMLPITIVINRKKNLHQSHQFSLKQYTKSGIKHHSDSHSSEQLDVKHSWCPGLMTIIFTTLIHSEINKSQIWFNRFQFGKFNCDPQNVASMWSLQSKI